MYISSPRPIRSVRSEQKQNIMATSHFYYCEGISRGSSPEILAFVGRAMQETGEQLLSISREKDGGIKTFPGVHHTFGDSDAKFSLGGLIAKRVEGGFAIYSNGCTDTVPVVLSSTKVRRCDECKAKQKSGRKFIGRQHKPTYSLPGLRTPIKNIIKDRRSSGYVIRCLREELAEVKKQNAKLSNMLQRVETGKKKDPKTKTKTTSISKICN